MNALPPTWTRSALSEVVDVGPRDSPLSEAAPFVPMGAVEVGQRYPAFYEERGKRGGCRASGGDVLFARITPCLENGKVAQLPRELSAVGGSTEFIVLRPGPEVDSGYLYYWCLEPSVRQRAESMMSGATGRMRLAGNDLARFAFPRPSLAEQRRIVDILEDHLSRLDASGELLRSALARAKAMRAAHLAATWRKAAQDRGLMPVHTIGPVVTGSTPTRNLAGAFSGDVPFLTPGDIGTAGRRVASSSRTLTRAGAAASRVVGPHAVVVVCIGATLGKVGWVSTPVVTNQQINSVVIDPAVNAPQFVAAMVASPQFQDQMARAASSTTMPILNKSKFGRLELPVPALGTQRALSDELSAHRASTERLEANVATGQHRSQALRRALLVAAFSGKLTGRVSDLDRVEELAVAGSSS